MARWATATRVNKHDQWPQWPENYVEYRFVHLCHDKKTQHYSTPCLSSTVDSPVVDLVLSALPRCQREASILGVILSGWAGPGRSRGAGADKADRDAVTCMLLVGAGMDEAPRVASSSCSIDLIGVTWRLGAGFPSSTFWVVFVKL